MSLVYVVVPFVLVVRMLVLEEVWIGSNQVVIEMIGGIIIAVPWTEPVHIFVECNGVTVAESVVSL